MWIFFPGGCIEVAFVSLLLLLKPELFYTVFAKEIFQELLSLFRLQYCSCCIAFAQAKQFKRVLTLWPVMQERYLLLLIGYIYHPYDDHFPPRSLRPIQIKYCHFFSVESGLVLVHIICFNLNQVLCC